MKRKLWRAGIILPEIVVSLGLSAVCLVLFCGWAGEVILNQRRLMQGVSADLERLAGVSWFVTQLKQCSRDPATWLLQGTDKIVFIKNGAEISFEVRKGRLMRYHRSDFAPMSRHSPKNELRNKRRRTTADHPIVQQHDGSPQIPEGTCLPLVAQSFSVGGNPWRREKLIERRGAGGGQHQRRRKTAAVILQNVDRMVCKFWPERTRANKLAGRIAQKVKRVTGVYVTLHMQDGTKVSIDVAFRIGERVW